MNIQNRSGARLVVYRKLDGKGNQRMKDGCGTVQKVE